MRDIHRFFYLLISLAREWERTAFGIGEATRGDSRVSKRTLQENPPRIQPILEICWFYIRLSLISNRSLQEAHCRISWDSKWKKQQPHKIKEFKGKASSKWDPRCRRTHVQARIVHERSYQRQIDYRARCVYRQKSGITWRMPQIKERFSEFYVKEFHGYH